MDEQVDRHAARRLAEISEYLRIVLVGGPRQAGKSTLLRQFIDARKGSYRTLDDSLTRQAALDDPRAFVSTGPVPMGLDEVQLGGDELLRALKIAVDTDPLPGRFVLSGSTRFLTIPTLSESLAGRIAFIDLWPLSVAEKVRHESSFLSRAFTETASLAGESAWSRDQYLDVITTGGYPEVARIPAGIARRAWYDAYLSTVVDRDIADFATISSGRSLRTLLGLVVARAGSLAVLTDLARGAELARDTARNYLGYLDMAYLTATLPPWSDNRTARLVKTAKIYPTDSGLAAHLLGVDVAALAEPGHPQIGMLTETFVVTELLKLLAVSDEAVSMFHVRTSDKHEVDLLLERADGRLVAVEIKASTSPGPSALKGLRWLKGRWGSRLHAGILLHLGSSGASHGDGIYSAPVSALWDHHLLPGGSGHAR